MSGHSKWAQIHRQKSVADNKKGAIFTKLANAITIAARSGGEVEANFKLRLAVDQARATNMPKDNIERAIKRGTGELAGNKIEVVTYEGFGPGGTAFIIECLTDNRNRTSSAIKHLLSQYGGSLGGPSSVSWLFAPKGVIRSKNISEGLELELIDAGAQDIQKEEDGFAIYTAPADLKIIKEFLENKGLKVEYAEIEQVAKDKKPVVGGEKEKIQKLFDELDESEDVNNYYTNAEV